MSSNIKGRFPDGIFIISNNYSASSRQKIKGIKKLAPILQLYVVWVLFP